MHVENVDNREDGATYSIYTSPTFDARKPYITVLL